MKLIKQIEIEVSHKEVEDAMFEASAFDKLSLIIRLSKTITQAELDEIAEFMGDKDMQTAAESIKQLYENVFLNLKGD